MEKLDSFDLFLFSRKLQLITLFSRETGSFNIDLANMNFICSEPNINQFLFQIRVNSIVFQYFEKKIVEKPIFLFKVLYHCSNLMPIKI